jgi:uncharacterized cupredoxin-like copper-binding protein
MRAALLVLALAAVLAPAAGAKPRPPARLLVEAREYDFTLSRQSIRHGRAVVQLAVRGEDSHDLRLVRLRDGRPSGRVRRVAETRPGETADWRGSLQRGRFRLYCSLPGHEKAGMHALLRVR